MFNEFACKIGNKNSGRKNCFRGFRNDYSIHNNRGFRDYYTGEATTVSNGSGFIVGQDGLILTNAHVVEGRPRAMIEIQLQDGRTFPGRVEDLDKLSDLATVRIDCKNLPVIRLGNSSDIRPGEFVVALGSPLALSNTITTGVVSTVARDQKVLPTHLRLF